MRIFSWDSTFFSHNYSVHRMQPCIMDASTFSTVTDPVLGAFGVGISYYTTIYEPDPLVKIDSQIFISHFKVQPSNEMYHTLQALWIFRLFGGLWLKQDSFWNENLANAYLAATGKRNKWLIYLFIYFYWSIYFSEDHMWM